MPTPLQLDPTRTTGLRRRMIAEMERRFNRLKREIVQLVVTEDAFGLKKPAQQFTTNTRWVFRTDADKVKGFREWFQERVNAGILSVDTAGNPWTAEYVHSAYRQGVIRAFMDARPDLATASTDFFNGSQAQFLREAFNQPQAVSKLQLISTRAYDHLGGVTTQMGNDISRVLADGLSAGRSPRDIARELTKQVDIGKVRARRIARTEIIHAHAEGQLDGLEKLGVEDVGVLVEWSTAGDNRVCQQCSSMQGVVISIKKARGLIPRHPNCRCAWIPAGVHESGKGQKKTLSSARRAIKQSVRAEKPKAKSARAAAKASTWRGADLLSE